MSMADINPGQAVYATDEVSRPGGIPLKLTRFDQHV